ncbi:MAG: NAD-dependent epimerase/dehydratase family protein [Bacteroidales bacterium]|nr:NAD-dependent epimerase/dehydratase family protein [Bacteroidales bacterium]
MNIVTGATGLVGSHLLYELCKRGKNIRAITRNKSNIKQVEAIFSFYTTDYSSLLSLIEWEEADIRDYSRLCELIGPGDEVFHCAAEVAFSKKEKTKVIQSNIGGTSNIVNACLEKGARKLCHVSSVAAIGKGEQGLPADESCIWDSTQRHTVYSLSKFHSEMEVWRGIEEGLSAVIVNPSIILGPTLSSKGTGALLNAVGKGLKFYPPGSMGFVDVRDVARIMVLLMENDISGERFILNSENLSYKEFLTLAAHFFGQSPPYIPIKRWMGELAIVVSSLIGFFQRKPSVLSKEIIYSAFSKDSFSSQKVINQLQYSFIPVAKSLENIIEFNRFYYKE